MWAEVANSSFQMKCSHERSFRQNTQLSRIDRSHCLFNAFFSLRPIQLYRKSLKMKMVYIFIPWMVHISCDGQERKRQREREMRHRSMVFDVHFSVNIIDNGVKCMCMCGFQICQKNNANKTGKRTIRKSICLMDKRRSPVPRIFGVKNAAIDEIIKFVKRDSKYNGQRLRKDSIVDKSLGSKNNLHHIHICKYSCC